MIGDVCFGKLMIIRVRDTKRSLLLISLTAGPAAGLLHDCLAGLACF